MGPKTTAQDKAAPRKKSNARGENAACPTYLEVGWFRLRGVFHGVGYEVVGVGSIVQVLLHHDALSYAGIAHVEHVVCSARQPA